MELLAKLSRQQSIIHNIVSRDMVAIILLMKFQLKSLSLLIPGDRPSIGDFVVHILWRLSDSGSHTVICP